MATGRSRSSGRRGGRDAAIPVVIVAERANAPRSQPQRPLPPSPSPERRARQASQSVALHTAQAAPSASGTVLTRGTCFRGRRQRRSKENDTSVADAVMAPSERAAGASGTRLARPRRQSHSGTQLLVVVLRVNVQARVNLSCLNELGRARLLQRLHRLLRVRLDGPAAQRLRRKSPRRQCSDGI